MTAFEERNAHPTDASQPSRRTVLTAAAWSAPVIAVAAAMPLAAASTTRAYVEFAQPQLEVPLPAAGEPSGTAVMTSATLFDGTGQPTAGVVNMAFSDGFLSKSGNLTSDIFTVVVYSTGLFNFGVCARGGAADGATGSITATVQNADTPDVAAVLTTSEPMLCLSNYWRGQATEGGRVVNTEITAVGGDQSGTTVLTYRLDSGVFDHALLDASLATSPDWSVTGEGTNTVSVRYTGTIADGISLIVPLDLAQTGGATGSMQLTTEGGLTAAPTVPVRRTFA